MLERKTETIKIKKNYKNNIKQTLSLNEFKKIIQNTKQRGFLALGLDAITITSLLSLETNYPFGIIRTKKKGYGTNKHIEGWSPDSNTPLTIIISKKLKDYRNLLEKLPLNIQKIIQLNL
ncbi:MAG: hypothetical protein VW378_00815 [bacterium]